MRRAHRSIEVFDISLMAVVTKAMGAFLVLMIIFMPYYQSGPVGSGTGADLAKAIEETQQDLTEAMKRLVENADPSEIAKLLEKARRELNEAQRLIEQLRSENDQLNAQVARLEGENQEMNQRVIELEEQKQILQAEVESLKSKLSEQKYMLSANLLSWDCPDVRLTFGFVTSKIAMYLDEKRTVSDKYVLKYGDPGYGNTIVTPESYVLKTLPEQNEYTQGVGRRFSTASTQVYVAPNEYALVVVSQDLTAYEDEKKQPFYKLKLAKNDCTGVIMIATTSPKGTMVTSWTERFLIPKNQYAFIPGSARVGPTQDDKDNTLTFYSGASDEMTKWLVDQIAHTEKAP